MNSENLKIGDRFYMLVVVRKGGGPAVTSATMRPDVYAVRVRLVRRFKHEGLVVGCKNGQRYQLLWKFHSRLLYRTKAEVRAFCAKVGPSWAEQGIRDALRWAKFYRASVLANWTVDADLPSNAREIAALRACVPLPPRIRWC